MVENGTLFKVIYTEDGVLKKTDFMKGSIESRNIKWRGKIVKTMKVDQRAIVVELED